MMPDSGTIPSIAEESGMAMFHDMAFDHRDVRILEIVEQAIQRQATNKVPYNAKHFVVTGFPRVTGLSLDYFRCTELPDEIGDLTALSKLSLSVNNLTTLPD